MNSAERRWTFSALAPSCGWQPASSRHHSARPELRMASHTGNRTFLSGAALFLLPLNAGESPPATRLPDAACVATRFVYVLKNNESPQRYYIGIASDVARRTAEHNAGNCLHTAEYRPSCVDLLIEFPDENRAVVFERYLSQGQALRSRIGGSPWESSPLRTRSSARWFRSPRRRAAWRSGRPPLRPAPGRRRGHRAAATGAQRTSGRVSPGLRRASR
jgi:putative endonuclease